MECGRNGGGIPPPTAAVKFCWLNYEDRRGKAGERQREGRGGRKEQGVRGRENAKREERREGV